MSETSYEIFQLERDGVDQTKEELSDAHHALFTFVETEEEREALYRLFDVQDREFVDCRIKILERIHEIERAQNNSKPKSVASSISTTSKTSHKSSLSRSLADSVCSRRIDAATRKAKLEVEVKFLEQELEARRFQLVKDISLANGEEDAIKRILEEDHEPISKPIIDRNQLVTLKGKKSSRG